MSEKLFRTFAEGLESSLSSAIIGSILKLVLAGGSCTGAAADILGAGADFGTELAPPSELGVPEDAPAAAATAFGLANAGGVAGFSEFEELLHCSRSRINSWPD